MAEQPETSKVDVDLIPTPVLTGYILRRIESSRLFLFIYLKAERGRADLARDKIGDLKYCSDFKISHRKFRFKFLYSKTCRKPRNNYCLIAI